MTEKRKTWIRVIIVVVLLSILSLTNRFWLPQVLNFAVQNQNQIDALDKLLGLILNILGGDFLNRNHAYFIVFCFGQTKYRKKS